MQPKSNLVIAQTKFILIYKRENTLHLRFNFTNRYTLKLHTHNPLFGHMCPLTKHFTHPTNLHIEVMLSPLDEAQVLLEEPQQSAAQVSLRPPADARRAL